MAVIDSYNFAELATGISQYANETHHLSLQITVSDQTEPALKGWADQVRRGSHSSEQLKH